MGNKLNICLTEYIVCYPLFPQAGLVGKGAIRAPSTPTGFPNALEDTAEVLGTTGYPKLQTHVEMNVGEKAINYFTSYEQFQQENPLSN